MQSINCVPDIIAPKGAYRIIEGCSNGAFKEVAAIYNLDTAIEFVIAQRKKANQFNFGNWLDEVLTEEIFLKSSFTLFNDKGKIVYC